MLISLNWLRDYVDVDVSPEQLAEDLTMAGLNVEGLDHRPNTFAPLLVGRVLTCEKHPNADRLSVCTVDIGEDKPRDIVCGAPNVRAGLEVVVIPAGATLPDGTLIKKGKIRGARSEGMICSEIELGLGEDASGIIELSLGEEPGASFAKHHGEEDWILDIEVTPNRPDQLGYLGVAREVSAIYGKKLRLPDTEIPAASLQPLAPVPVEIRDPEGCPRYIARRLDEVGVAASPAWLCRRLESAGLRPINNVVDITNFVLLETGHPLHAFDAAKLQGAEIIVRRAAAGERTTTLEEETITLDPDDLVIADAERSVAIAGVMGCENSKVEEGTKVLVLESAYFDSASIRRTRQRHELSTDSSYRFERVADFDMAAFASARATRLLVELAGATAASTPNDVFPRPPAEHGILLRLAKLNGLLGTTLDADAVATLLARLELPAVPEGEDLRVAVPTFRRDLAQEIDLIEEVARLYGYNRVPAENLVRNTLYSALSDEERSSSRLHGLIVGLGYQEVLTSSFMDERTLDLMKLPQDDPRRRLVTVRNPLVSFNSKMRSSLLPGMLDVLKTNFHRGQDELRIYQLGRVYLHREGEKLPEEPTQFAVLLSGGVSPEHWSLAGAPASLADLSGLTEALVAEAGLDVETVFENTDSYLSPGMSFTLRMGDVCVGQGGLLRPSLLRDLKQKRDVFCLELFHVPLEGIPESRYQPIPAYPALRRDLALIIPDGVRWQQVADALTRAGGKWLESHRLFDVYRGEGIPENTGSYAVRLVFRSMDATLSDKQVDKQLQRILKSLKDSLQVSLRS